MNTGAIVGGASMVCADALTGWGADATARGAMARQSAHDGQARARPGQAVRVMMGPRCGDAPPPVAAVMFAVDGPACSRSPLPNGHEPDALVAVSVPPVLVSNRPNVVPDGLTYAAARPPLMEQIATPATEAVQ